MCSFLLVLLPLHPVLPSTHWVVTESGKIQAQPDSIYFLRQPHDFVAFIHQEQRVLETNNLHHELTSIRGSLDENHNAEVPDVEAQLLAEDPDCLLAGRPLTQFDLYVSTLVPLRSNVLETMESDSLFFIDENTKLKEPWCSKKEIMKEIRLPFVDQLKSVANRINLTMQGEAGLAQILLDDGRIQLSHYGHLVAYGLNKEKTNWVTYNLAGLYWRMKGDAFESIECLRRAIHFGEEERSREARPVSLISLANVLHQSLEPEDAAKVLEVAVDHDPTESVGHYTLGNVYAVLMQFNKSIASFDYALRITPDLPWVEKRKAAVKCHQKLEEGLERQHTKLQKTLEELRAYQKQHEKWANMNSKVNSVQAPLEMRVASRLSYERFTFLTEGRTIRPQGCYETLDRGKKFVECVVNSVDPASNKIAGQTIYRRNAPVASEKANEDPQSFEEVTENKGKAEELEDYADKLDEEAEKLEAHAKTLEDEADQLELGGDAFIGPERKPAGYEELDRNKPTLEKIYPNLKNKYADAEKRKYEKKDWPSKDECKKFVSRFPDWSQLPSVYLPARNKGFDMEAAIGEKLALEQGAPHPLPWFPPLCDPVQAAEVKLPARFATLVTSLKQVSAREKFPEESVKPKLQESFGRVDESENIAELGARLKSAKESSDWPAWLLNHAAGNYWRVVGNPIASSDCFLMALAEAPVVFRDLVLTNLAALLYRLGHIDTALKIAQESITVCNTEPETHFLLGNILAAKGNMSGAVAHYRSALQLEPTYPHGLAQLRIPSCYLKFHSLANKAEQVHGGGSCSGDFFSDRSHQKSCSSEGEKVDAQQSLTSIQGTTDYIYCKDGQCQFVTQKYVDRLQATEDGAVASATENTSNGHSCAASPSSEHSCPPKNAQTGNSECEDIGGGKVEKPLEKPSKEDESASLSFKPAEIVTVALTEEDDLDEIFDEPAKPTRKQSFQDDTLPEILLKVERSGLKTLLDLSDENCNKVKINWKAFTSTWLSVSAKEIKFSDHLAKSATTTGLVEPHCAVTPVSIRSMDHLVGVRRRGELKYGAEVGLMEAFQSLAGQVDKSASDGVAKMATRIGVSLLQQPNSWVLSTAASLYWRVKGNALEALECVRHSLYHCPNSMRDVPLLSLANIMHRAGLYHDAVIATNLALRLSPNLVISHFTMANIYTSMGDIEKAKQFYMSTLGLHSTFEPAIKRLMAILCGKK